MPPSDTYSPTKKHNHFMKIHTSIVRGALSLVSGTVKTGHGYGTNTYFYNRLNATQNNGI